MELIEYIRLRNKMTQSEWEDSFEKKEREIIVLRHEGGGGSLRNGFWEWEVHLQLILMMMTFSLDTA